MAYESLMAESENVSRETFPSQSKNHSSFNRREKMCVKCGENPNMPSSSYCLPCHKAYLNHRKNKLKGFNPEFESDMVKDSIQGENHE